jgi:hypothetical protein
MKKSLILLLLLVVPVIAQQKEQNGRYQIIQIPSLAQHDVNVIDNSLKTEKDILCLDTQTGKTWLLTSYLQALNDSLRVQRFEWMPILFTTVNYDLRPGYYESPKELKK